MTLFRCCLVSIIIRSVLSGLSFSLDELIDTAFLVEVLEMGQHQTIY